MQSKVILFCAVLFCSQIVDSTSRREGRFRQRVNSPSNWQVDQSAPNPEYTDFTQIRDVNTLTNPAIDRKSTPNYLPNQGLYSEDGIFTSIPVALRTPPSSSHSSAGPDSIVISDLQEDGGSLDNNPLVESYPSEVFDNQQFRNKNWRPASQFTNFDSNSVPIPTDNRSPSVNNVQEPYGIPQQYFTSTNRQVYQPNNPYLARKPFQYPLAHNAGDSFADRKPTAPSLYDDQVFAASDNYRSVPRTSHGPVTYERIREDQGYNEGKATTSEIKGKLNADRRPTKRLAPQTGTNYNESPSGIGTGSLENRSKNIFTDTAPSLYDDEVFAASDNYRTVPRTSHGPVTYERIREDQGAASEAKPRPRGGRRPAQKNPARVSIGKKADDIIKILSDTPLARKYARIHRSDSGTSNMDDSYDGIPTGIKEQSGNDEYGSSGSTPSNTNLNHNIYNNALGIPDIHLNKLVTQPEMQKVLAESDSRFLIIHPNGTVENVNKINLESHQNSNVRLVNTNGKNVADTEGNGTQSPDNVPNNIAKTSAPEDEFSLPTNNQPVLVNQTNPAEESDSNLPIKNLPGDQSNSNTLTPLVNQPGQVNDTNSSSPRENKPDVDKVTLPSNGNPAEDYKTFNPLQPHRRHPTRRNKFRHLHGNQPTNDNDSRPSSQNENQSAVRHPHRRHQAQSKSKPLHGNQPAEGGNDLSSSNQLSDAKDSVKGLPLLLNQNQSENDSYSKPSDESQQGDNNKSKPLYSPKRKPNHHIKSKPSPVNQSADDDISPENKPGDNNNPDSLSENKNQSDDENQTDSENRPEDDKTSKPLRPYENQSTGDSKPTLSDVSKIDEQSDSTTYSPTAPNDTTSPKPKKRTYRHHHRKSTTSSPIVYSTTPSSEKPSEDQIITLSPIEQVTDNVSDAQPVTTTTTTAKPIETLGKIDTTEDANNKQSDEQEDASSSSEDLTSTLEKLQTSTTTASPSSSTSPTDITTDDKTPKETAESKDTQTNDKTIKSQGNNGKNDIQTVQSAVYDSSELLDTNTDVPAESDDYSPATTSPSVHNDVDSGDASGDNRLEIEQPETDVTITVSSSKANDSEDEIITIKIEISESTGLSGNDKTLVVSIDTDNDDDDDAKTPKSSGSGSQSSDCNKDHDDGRGKNLEIDMSNIQGEPTIWIRTTNQDFIDKLTDKNDTSFDIVYFINNVNQPAIERVKETTIHCNGTVVIESKEITYANKDDPTPTITKTTQTIQIEDYKRFGLDLS